MSILPSSPPNAKSDHILGLSQFVSLAGPLTLEQVTVGRGLLQESSVDGIALLKFFLRGSVLVDEAGDPRLRAGGPVRLANAVKDVRGDEAANGDVEAALLGGRCMLAIACRELESN